MEKSYKIVEIEHECNRLKKMKHKAIITSIFSTFALGVSIVSLVAFTSFEPLNTLDKEKRELFIMLLSVIGTVDLYALINSICRKVGLELRINDLLYQKRMESLENSTIERKKSR